MDLVAAAIVRLETTDGYASVFPGGIYDRTIRKSGRASTPGAFDAAGEVRVCASLTSTVADDPSGEISAAIGILTIWIRGPESPAGRAAVRLARSWTRAALTLRPIPVGNGSGVVLRTADFLDVQSDPTFENGVLSTLRMQTAGVW